MLTREQEEFVNHIKDLLKSCNKEQLSAVKEALGCKPSDNDMRTAFLHLWDHAVKSSEYKSKEWDRFREMLRSRGIEV